MSRLIVLLVLSLVFGATAQVQAQAPSEKAATHFPENTPLPVLLEWAQDVQNVRFLHGPELTQRTFTLRGGVDVPPEHALDLVRAVLRMHDYLLEETGVPGLLRIVSQEQLPGASSLDASPLGDAVTEVMRVEHVTPQEIVQAISVFKSSNGQVRSSPGGLLILTDFDERVSKMRELAEALDQPGGRAIVEAIPVQYGDPSQLAAMLQPLLRQDRNRDGEGRPQQAATIAADPRTRSLVVAGLPEQVEEVRQLVQKLDQAPTVERVVYRPKYLPVEKLETFLATLEPDAGMVYRLALDPEQNLAVLNAPAYVHDKVEWLLGEVDREPLTASVPVRVYTLKNALAKDILSTIQSLDPGGGLASGSTATTPEPRGGVPIPRAFRPVDMRQVEREDTVRLFESDEPVERADQVAGDDDEALTVTVPLGGGQSATQSVSAGAPPEPRIAADESTNSIIVIAPPSQQRVYERIIEVLDRRRPQVLIEATVVTLDTSEGYTIGVDIAAGEDVGDARILSFSAFGISEVDATAPSLNPLAAAGGTFAVLSPDIADIVIRALATDTRSQLLSIPRVLVNDNEPARLENKDEQPFEQSVTPNGDFVFNSAEYAEAGTKIEVTPTISQDDYLLLEFDVELSNFTAAAPGPGLPPPRQTNSIASHVTIPDGYTIIVGGLNTSTMTETIRKVPLLGDIPIIQHLFRSTTRDDANKTLFVFIRPTIFRRDDFGDLRAMSRVDREAAGLDPSHPISEPLLIRPGALSPEDLAPADSEPTPGADQPTPLTPLVK